VLITGVRPGSEALRKGLRRGDLVQEINREPVASVLEYEQTVARVKPGQAVLLLVRRGDSTNFVGLRMPE
jgi:serine protease Do